ncbi:MULTISPECIES: hypothetical protein, partial [Enterobacteriaceae]|uniref:hypothetical protein n=1 Tax=Enterobacteriaceae TaxID=543 RepID=UPI001A8FC9A9
EPAAGTGKNPVFGQSDIEWYHLTSDCLSCIDCTICGAVPGYKIVAAYVQISLLKGSFVFDHLANV